MTAFQLGTAALDGDDRILYDPTTGALRYDVDGTGAAAAHWASEEGAGMEPLMFVMAILGCGESDAACQEVR